MAETKEFHLGDLLSITDGHLVSPRHIYGVYDICDFVTGEKHMTHQLMRVAEVIKPWLLEQHPWLADIKVPDGLGSKEAVLTWLVGATEKYGPHHPVEAMPFGAYVGRDPMAEARELMPNAKFIAVDLPPSVGGQSEEKR